MKLMLACWRHAVTVIKGLLQVPDYRPFRLCLENRCTRFFFFFFLTSDSKETMLSYSFHMRLKPLTKKKKNGEKRSIWKHRQARHLWGRARLGRNAWMPTCTLPGAQFFSRFATAGRVTSAPSHADSGWRPPGREATIWFKTFFRGLLPGAAKSWWIKSLHLLKSNVDVPRNVS